MVSVVNWLSGTQSDSAVFEARQRVCDVCALRVPCQHNDDIVYRCSSEPVRDYESKGGRSDETVGVRFFIPSLTNLFPLLFNPSAAPTTSKNILVEPLIFYKKTPSAIKQTVSDSGRGNETELSRFSFVDRSERFFSVTIEVSYPSPTTKILGSSIHLD